jgi:hypothetical protein
MKTKVLFFIKGSVPTEVEKSQASEIVGNVVFRNAKFAGGEPPEICDGVAGCVPENYKKFETISGETKPAKRGYKPRKAEESDNEQEIQQTSLIPAETGWKANS